MKLPTIALLVVTLSIGACASLIQTASISEAYKHYERQQYDRTLELISQAENAKADGGLPPSTFHPNRLTHLIWRVPRALDQNSLFLTMMAANIS